MTAARPCELAELRRQGAKAAARGEPLDANPMLAPPNLPQSTGESEPYWSLRREAWRQGYEFQRASSRATRTAAARAPAC